MTLQRHLAALAGGPTRPPRPRPSWWAPDSPASRPPASCRRGSTRCSPTSRPRVILVDHNPHVGSDMGASARPVIEAALTANGWRAGSGCASPPSSEDGVTLSTGEMLAASTVVWCAGMRANPLTADLGVARDRLGRVAGRRLPACRSACTDVFAAGDVAAATMDDTHLSVMSCQHGRPMGRFAGYNVVSDLLGEPMLPLRIPWYVTVLDLGPGRRGLHRGLGSPGGRHRCRSQERPSSRSTPQRIYPPLDGDREAILAAAAPTLQSPPARGAG